MLLTPTRVLKQTARHRPRLSPRENDTIQYELPTPPRTAPTRLTSPRSPRASRSPLAEQALRRSAVQRGRMELIKLRLDKSEVLPTPLSELNKEERANLWRVFATLCNYCKQKRLQRRLRPMEDRLERLLAHIRTPSLKIYPLVPSSPAPMRRRRKRRGRRGNRRSALQQSTAVENFSRTMYTSEVRAERDELRKKIASLKRRQAQLRPRPGQGIRITVADIMQCFADNGVFKSKAECEQMVWEVDENLDGAVDFDELQRTWTRIIRDRSGREPSTLFDLVHFMVYDSDDSGKISLDETLKILFLRYGRAGMQARAQEMFERDMDRDGALDLKEYISLVSAQREATVRSLTIVSEPSPSFTPIRPAGNGMQRPATSQLKSRHA